LATGARRIHHPLRVAVTASTCEELQHLLARSIESVENTRPITLRGSPPVAFAFAGQGSLYIGAGKKLYQSMPEFATELQKYDHFCWLHGFPSITNIIDGSVKDGDVAPLASSLAIGCVEMALANMWKLLGIYPRIVVGHSLGEYAALHVTGVLSASDAIYFVGMRAKLVSQMCEIGSHSMLAVRATTDQIQQCVIDMPFEYACRNSKTETVLAGRKTEIQPARHVLQERGHKCHELDVPFTFHSAQVDPALDEFEILARRAIFKALNILVISLLKSNVISDGKTFNAC
jgi:acyl transferase domain-containing protein